MLVSDNLEMVAFELMIFGMSLGERVVLRQEMHRHTHTHQLLAKELLRMASAFCLFSSFY